MLSKKGRKLSELIQPLENRYFLSSEINSEVESSQDIIDGLNLISEYLQTNLFLPNNINFPHQRKKFIDDFKS